MYILSNRFIQKKRIRIRPNSDSKIGELTFFVTDAKKYVLIKFCTMLKSK